MTVEIPLSRGLVALIDTVDADLIGQWKWYALKTSRHQKAPHFYAVRNSPRGEGKRHLIPMHRVIVGASKGKDVDHINGNTLDNRRANLRLATRAQNIASRHHFSNRHGFLGVSCTGLRFRARIDVARKPIFSEIFATVEEAAAAYDRLALEHFGEFASLNFPNLRPSKPPFCTENRSENNV
jgi:hypothetical protein